MLSTFVGGIFFWLENLVYLSAIKKNLRISFNNENQTIIYHSNFYYVLWL